MSIWSNKRYHKAWKEVVLCIKRYIFLRDDTCTKGAVGILYM